MINNNMICLYLYLLGFLYGSCNSHPQCVDPPDAPFPLNEENVFCQRYINFTCCTADKNRNLENRYNAIKLQIEDNSLWDTDRRNKCLGYLKDLLCQECSPYAAHAFEIQPTFPEICPQYCSNVYDDCEFVLNQVIKDSTIKASLNNSKDEFCNMVYDNTSIYCYPEILNNTDLNRDINRQTSSDAGCLCLVEVASGLYNPLRMVPHPSDPARIYILEQHGLIKVFVDWNELEKTFLDLSGIIKQPRWSGDENGLLGLCFDLHYKTNRKLYVAYTIYKEGFTGESIISQFLHQEGNPDEVDLDSEIILLRVDQPGSWHNGGELICEEVGYLYVFFGDGGGSHDPSNNAQNRQSFLGAILKLNVANVSVSQPYTIPEDNPFINDNETLSEIYAYGFRQPWRASADRGDPETGEGKDRKFVSDVGQGRWEEIDLIVEAGNFGWRPWEGTHCAKPDRNECFDLPIYTWPIFEYRHGEMGRAVAGGYVYRGCQNPSLNGRYFFGDHTSGKLYALTQNKTNPDNWDFEEMFMCGTDVCYNGWTNEYGLKIMGFGEDYNGELYLMSGNAVPTEPTGQVFKIVDPNRRGDPSSCRSIKQPAIPCGALTNPSNGAVKIVLFGSTAKYSCNSGYKLVGNARRYCIGGNWDGDEPVCEEKTCEVLSNPDNGVVKFSDKQNENSKATFKCKAGFVRVGVKTLVCQSGLWNNDPPVCEASDIICDPPDSPTNGKVSTPDGLKVNAEAKYKCNIGFKLDGKKTRTCFATGNWGGKSPVCVEANSSQRSFCRDAYVYLVIAHLTGGNTPLRMWHTKNCSWLVYKIRKPSILFPVFTLG